VIIYDTSNSDSPLSVVKHDRNWVYLVSTDGQLLADWDAANIDARQKHMSWGKSDNEEFNIFLGKVVCTTGCPVRLVEASGIRAAYRGRHPHFHVV
jgi:hypothetical protein